MSAPVLELVDTGLGSSLQDAGRVGWKRFGVPPGGALDDHAACAANRLVGNPEDCSLLEVLLQGVRVRALVPIDLAVTGAAFGDHHEGGWRVHRLQTGEEFTVPPPPRGVWSYLAVPGGFDGERWFGSVSIFPRGGLGQPLVRGSLLHRLRVPSDPPSAVAGRWWDPQEQRNYSRPPALRVWRGPQWEAFSPAARAAFFETP